MTGSPLSSAQQHQIVPVLHSSEDGADLAIQLGSAHYSYRFAEQKFMGLLTQAGIRPIPIAAPEYFFAKASLKQLPVEIAGGEPHLIFRSTENIRLLRGACNIACFAWEFPVLKSETLAFEHPFLNQRRMLNACDETWVPCHFTASVLRHYGVANVVVLPAPIAEGVYLESYSERRDALFALFPVESVDLQTSNRGHREALLQLNAACVRSIFERVEIPAAMKSRKVLLTVLNPGDARKNLTELLLGFLQVLDRHPEAVLIVKLVVSADHAESCRVLVTQLIACFDQPITLSSQNVIIISQYLLPSQMTALYRIADFYLCASVAEGQNLPLLEAMAEGAIPISVSHTAMADYIDNTNAYLIQTRPLLPARQDMAGNGTGQAYSVDFASQRDVARAIYDALAAPVLVLEERRRRSMARVQDCFGEKEILGRMTQRWLSHPKIPPSWKASAQTLLSEPPNAYR